MFIGSDSLTEVSKTTCCCGSPPTRALPPLRPLGHRPSCHPWVGTNTSMVQDQNLNQILLFNRIQDGSCTFCSRWCSLQDNGHNEGQCSNLSVLRSHGDSVSKWVWKGPLLPGVLVSLSRYVTNLTTLPRLYWTHYVGQASLKPLEIRLPLSP